MPIGTIVWVPFPFVESPRLRERPALVIGLPATERGMRLLWVTMVTSAANRGWRGDISLEGRFAECGLQVPCVIRTAKIATIEAGQARAAGTIPADLLAAVQAELARTLGFAAP